MFIHQIHYTPLQIKQLNVNKIDLPLFTWFLQNKEQFLKMENGKEKYFVPTKEEFKQKTNPQEFHELLTSQRQSNECIFLAWDANGFPECRIQEFKPQMCKDYPDNKGGACLNHKERYYSRAFFEFQKRTVDMPIKVLKEFYYGKLTDERAYDILSLLMDYGRFRKQKVQLFFQNEFNYSVQDFEKLCKELLRPY
jgi:Fe-S-cluster containining protein